MSDPASRMPTFRSLDELADLLRPEDGRDLYARWSRGPSVDAGASRDELTGVPLPGLSANSLEVEPWWGDRSRTLWVARRLYDYAHLPRRRGPGVRPWVLRGDVVGRGPDNEPLVTLREPVGWIADEVLRAASDLVGRQRGRWGTLDRQGSAVEPSGPPRSSEPAGSSRPSGASEPSELAGSPETYEFPEPTEPPD